ncbi:MAG: hypothetical protein NTU67_06440 [Gemmatimonadetes bacterium]|nr:hypothetical protein [Gemmatimonadota bacterium]
MPASGLRFPVDRVLLHRTRLAYVHVRHLLTDAKRDRAARVFGYVGVWLPEEFLLLYLQEGELVNATRSSDGVRFQQIALADAVARVPMQAEFGDICFHEADDEQLAMMFQAQLLPPLSWPAELSTLDADAVLAYLHATMHDGTLEVRVGDDASYASVRFGRLVRGYFTNAESTDAEANLRRQLASSHAVREIRLFPVARPLPSQAAPSLVQAYRDLVQTAVARLEASGCADAPAIAERVRLALVQEHPALAQFGLAQLGRDHLASAPAERADPVQDARDVTAAIGAWLTSLLGDAAPTHGLQAPAVIASLTRERRHSFHSAGFFETLPWPVRW